MTQTTLTRRGALAGAVAALATSIVCLACVLPGIGAIVGFSVLVTAAGGIAEDGVLLAVGVATLLMGLTLGALVLVARRQSEPVRAQTSSVARLSATAEDQT
jgi:hypothetical protein